MELLIAALLLAILGMLASVAGVDSRDPTPGSSPAPGSRTPTDGPAPEPRRTERRRVEAVAAPNGAIGSSADAASCGNSHPHLEPPMDDRTITPAPMEHPGPAAARGRDGAGDPSPVDDPRALTILTTEHWSLLSARSLVYNEAFARAGMFLSFLAATLVALGLMSAAMRIQRGVPRHRRARARARPVHRPRDDGPRRPPPPARTSGSCRG